MNVTEPQAAAGTGCKVTLNPRLTGIQGTRNWSRQGCSGGTPAGMPPACCTR